MSREATAVVADMAAVAADMVVAAADTVVAADTVAPAADMATVDGADTDKVTTVTDITSSLQG